MTRSDPPRTGRPAIDLNADLGEGFPNDRLLLERITSANVCCGAHAGDPDAIAATLTAARDLGVIVGAHPGFPDREHFGRRERGADAAEIERLIVDQVEALRLAAENVRVSIRFLKPHGALYNQAQTQPEIARGVVQGALRLRLPLLGLPCTILAATAAERGLRYVAEGFPDRRYRPDGSLAPRSEPGALIHDPDETVDQVRRLIAAGVETLCIHGDDPAAVATADRVVQALDALGIVRRPWIRDEAPPEPAPPHDRKGG